MANPETVYAPVRDAILVAHGQPSDPTPPEKALVALAAQVEARLPGWRVRSATLAAPDAFEAALNAAAAGSLIYPFFMSDGWFVSQALPRRIGDRDVHVMDPFGTDHDLPAAAAETLRQQAARRNWPLDKVRVVLAAHGSGRSDAPAQRAYAFAEAVQALLPRTQIICGFVEQAPGIAKAASGLGEMSFCLPFFAQTGDHVLNDIPEALDAAGFRGAALPVVGQSPAVPDLIARALERAV